MGNLLYIDGFLFFLILKIKKKCGKSDSLKIFSKHCKRLSKTTCLLSRPNVQTENVSYFELHEKQTFVCFCIFTGKSEDRHHELLNLEISWLGFYKSYKLYSLGH